VKYRLGQSVQIWHMNTHADRHTHTCMHEHSHRSALGTYTCNLIHDALLWHLLTCR